MTEISIVTVEEQPLLAARTSVTFAEVPGKLLPLMDRVGTFVQEHGIEDAGQHVCSTATSAAAGWKST